MYEEDYPPLDSKHLNTIHEELEKLNIATDVINKLEVQLDGERAMFRQTQSTWSEKLKELSKQFSSHIAKARPYYELKVEEKKLKEESQKAAERFERANSMLSIAKQQVSLTQDSLSRQSNILPECLEVLNHHIQRVSEAEEERMLAEAEHASKAYLMLQVTEKIRNILKDNKSSIKKSRNYFEKRLEFTKILEAQKELILNLEHEVRQKKTDYTTSLRNLEVISDSIHEQRSIGECSLGDCSTNISSESPPLPRNPPPYEPTAPPPYEDNYVIEKDDDIVLRVVEEEQDEKRNSKTLGSGVILLAQQLMGSVDKNSNHTMKIDADISYHTRPICLSEKSADSSDTSSLASFAPGDDGMTAYLVNHNDLIKEIEDMTDRVDSLLRKPTVVEGQKA